MAHPSDAYMSILIEGVAEALELAGQLGLDDAKLAEAIEGGRTPRARRSPVAGPGDSLTIDSGWANVGHTVLAFSKRVGLSGTEILR
jgi:hypothetical protein